ncbi:MAG: hypothetical protein B6U68_02150 [Candidatus Aenigmarchaeota archaeon ex4484_14]|nr:MAG: hypothetical protein B6U68_02150 [Candidatus Aenigmarchaeota archaeon ex4484_14]
MLKKTRPLIETEKKIYMQDFVLAPDEKILIVFKGKNPFKMVETMKFNIKRIYQVPGKDIKTLHFKWDNTAQVRDFFAKWIITPKKDKWTKAWIPFIIQGTVDSKTNLGDFTFIMFPWITTIYTYANSLQKALWWLYNRYFYYEQRRNYIEEERKLAFQFRDAIIEQMGMKRRIYNEDRELF